MNTPPVAATRPHSFTAHGITIEDPWAWLKDAGYPDVTDKDVLAYLEAENAYFESEMAPHKPLAEGKEYFRLGALSVSNDGKLLAYAIDDNGSERFEVRVKNLETGEHLPEIIPGMLSEIVWAADDSGFLYGLANEQWRTDNVRFHRLGTAVADDVELIKEADEGI